MRGLGLSNAQRRKEDNPSLCLMSYMYVCQAKLKTRNMYGCLYVLLYWANGQSIGLSACVCMHFCFPFCLSMSLCLSLFLGVFLSLFLACFFVSVLPVSTSLCLSHEQKSWQNFSNKEAMKLERKTIERRDYL